ncbi:MAG: ABC transporter permease subunit [Elusimicrobia bacterium]|nr:ABC transporter permease subunit [Elusimicrobiota bacterium]
MFNKIYQIAKYTYIDNLKRRNFIILLLYIFIVLGSGFLFSMLSPAQEIRIILDLGTAAIEMFAFLSCTFISVRLILQEMEEKTVYLILSRPVTRTEYLLGRYFGILSVMLVYIVIMNSALVLMLLAKGWSWNAYMLAIAVTVFMKVVIISAFSILLSLVSTSAASSFISIFFLWVLGHFSEELKYINYLLKQSGVKITPVIKAVYYIIPNFSMFNFKDLFQVKHSFTGELFWISSYAVLYAAVVIMLSIFIFNKKEL